MPFDPILSFTLRQHTPHIHFQDTDPRATLRATEIKPKLDRFLIGKLGRIGNISPSWRVGREKAQSPALDYKLHFLEQARCIRLQIYHRPAQPEAIANLFKYHGHGRDIQCGSPLSDKEQSSGVFRNPQFR